MCGARVARERRQRDGVARVTPALADDVTTSLTVFRERVARDAERVALRPLDGAPITWGEWGEASRRVSASLAAAGFAPGGRVAILAGSHPVWPIAELGIVEAGLVSVGIYPTSAPEQVLHILRDAGVVAIVVDDMTQLAKVRRVAGDALSLRLVIGAGDAAAAMSAPDGPREIAWGRWLDDGAEALGRPGVREALEQRAAAVAPDDLAILVYTSGSTGAPKGARLTHRYLAASARSILATLPLTEADTTVSFLPASHAGERVFGLYTRIHAGMTATLVGDPSRVWEAMQRHEPTLFGGLPRFFEKAYEALTAAHARSRGAEREQWDTAVALGRVRSLKKRRQLPVATDFDVRWRAALAPVEPVLREFFGSRLRIATSGGAPLPVEVAEYLDAVGVTVLGAYGLTEHLCVAFHRPQRYGFDSVGPVMPGTTIRIAAEGEIQVRRTALTFDGYWARDAESRAAFTPDGEWLHTGDVGEITDDGTLRVTGRLKELIVLSSGKKVAPLPVEALLVEDPWIAQAALHGEGEKFVTALLFPRQTLVETWADEQGLASTFDQLLLTPAVQAHFQQAIDRVNATLARSEQVKKWLVLDRELSVDADELTPTHKLRRAVIATRFADRLRTLYDTEG